RALEGGQRRHWRRCDDRLRREGRRRVAQVARSGGREVPGARDGARGLREARPVLRSRRQPLHAVAVAGREGRRGQLTDEGRERVRGGDGDGARDVASVPATDEELMFAVRGGALDRLAELFRRHAPLLKSFFLRRTRDAAVSEDLV